MIRIFLLRYLFYRKSPLKCTFF